MKAPYDDKQFLKMLPQLSLRQLTTIVKKCELFIDLKKREGAQKNKGKILVGLEKKTKKRKPEKTDHSRDSLERLKAFRGAGEKILGRWPKRRALRIILQSLEEGLVQNEGAARELRYVIGQFHQPTKAKASKWDLASSILSYAEENPNFEFMIARLLRGSSPASRGGSSLDDWKEIIVKE